MAWRRRWRWWERQWWRQRAIETASENFNINADNTGAGHRPAGHLLGRRAEYRRHRGLLHPFRHCRGPGPGLAIAANGRAVQPPQIWRAKRPAIRRRGRRRRASSISLRTTLTGPSHAAVPSKSRNPWLETCRWRRMQPAGAGWITTQAGAPVPIPMATPTPRSPATRACRPTRCRLWHGQARGRQRRLAPAAPRRLPPQLRPRRRHRELRKHTGARSRSEDASQQKRQNRRPSTTPPGHRAGCDDRS